MASNDKVLDVKFYCNDLGRELTIREYFRELLSALWREKEMFSAKRPFGNSDWDIGIYRAIVDAGLINCQYGEDGEFDVDVLILKKMDEVILDAINGL